MTSTLTPTAGEYDSDLWPDGLPDGPPGYQPTNSANGRHLVTVAASSMKMKPTKWLYDGRIPAGAITLLAGREGIGKSTIGFDIVAQLTRGELPGRYLGTPRSVGIVASEDSWEAVILPRLVAAHADLDRVHRVEAVNPEGEYETVSAPADLQRLRLLCAEHDIALLVVDPIMSVISGTLDTHKDREVRQALDPLSRFASETGVGVLGLIHVNKSSTTDPLNSVMASRAFTAVARSVLYCVLDPESEGEDQYLFGHPKCNVGPKQATVGYRIIEVRLELDTADVEDGDEAVVVTSRVVWGDVDDRSIRDALEGPPKERAKGDLRTRIRAFIAAASTLVTTGSVVDEFPEASRTNIDKTLSVMVKAGELERPISGHYRAPVRRAA